MSSSGHGNRIPRPAGVAVPPESLANIPEAQVLTAPPTGSSTPTNQASVPAAQMAYTIARPIDMPSSSRHQHHHHQQQQPFQTIILQPRQGLGGPQPFVLTEEMLQQYLAAQGEGMVPPAPPNYLPLAICSCLCCWPVSLLAIMHSRSVNVLYARRQYVQAYMASRRAKMFSLMSIMTGTLFMLVYYLMIRRRQEEAGMIRPGGG